MPVTQNDSQPIWQNYIDLQNDTKRWLQIPSTDTTRDDDLQDLIDAACYWVQDFLGRPIAPTTFYRRFSGYSGFGGSYIQLPYYPVLSVASVVETWGTSGQHTLTEQSPTDQGGTDTYSLDPLRGLLVRSFAGLIARPWFPGLRNVEVTWTAGYNPIPPTVKLATREYIKCWWAKTQQTSRSFRPQGDYIENEPDPWPGVERSIKAMLQPLVQVGIG